MPAAMAARVTAACVRMPRAVPASNVAAEALRRVAAARMEASGMPAAEVLLRVPTTEQVEPAALP